MNLKWKIEIINFAFWCETLKMRIYIPVIVYVWYSCTFQYVGYNVVYLKKKIYIIKKKQKKT